ncbi:hypothetical protein [Mesorhizobium sp. LNJC403B00]|uniref:hypothetical protein n=1 Tax=Mesorhizobium sp. LNJC403B00 TaxID=1287280 RepID=UPI001FDAC929|nr:hypothetical protein [Mesorhizobium sp. LNJC403B00]
MTGTSVAPESRPVATDIVDADYEVLPQLIPLIEAMPTPARDIATPSIEGMEMLRKSDASAGRPASRGGPIFWIAGIGAALAAFWVSGGHALVRQTPFWSVEQPEGTVLSIAGVTTRVDASGPTPVLFVDGEAVNDGLKAGQLPPWRYVSPAMTAASPAILWGHPTVLWRPAKDSAFPAASMCLETASRPWRSPSPASRFLWKGR